MGRTQGGGACLRQQAATAAAAACFSVGAISFYCLLRLSVFRRGVGWGGHGAHGTTDTPWYTCTYVRTRVLTINLKSTSGTRTHVREQKKGSVVIGRVIIIAETQTVPVVIGSCSLAPPSLRSAKYVLDEYVLEHVFPVRTLVRSTRVRACVLEYVRTYSGVPPDCNALTLTFCHTRDGF